MAAPARWQERVEAARIEARVEAALSPTSDTEFSIRLPTPDELLRLQQPPPCVLLAQPPPCVYIWNEDFINRKGKRWELLEAPRSS